MFNRLIEQEIIKYIDNDKILLLLGARQVGKTSIIKNLKSYLEKEGIVSNYINLENPDFLNLLNEHPENLFKIVGKSESKKIIFIDEVQYLKNPSNFLKYIYDEYKGNIKLIVSGSSAFYIDKNFKDSLAGRKKIFYINTLNFEEFLIFKGQEHLIKYLKEKNVLLIDKNDLYYYYYEYITYGGYPDVVLEDDFEEKRNLLEEIGLSYIKKDILEAGVEYEDKYYFILKILSSQVGSLLNLNEISNTINLNVVTVEKYIYIMKKSFHIATITPFYQNIRKELTKMQKVYFYDLGLRNYFLNNFDSFDYRIDKGALFENIVFRNFLNKYKVTDLKFWRTQNKNEVDFIIEKDKKAYEVKVNKAKFDIKKYKLFLENYPDFKLELIDFDSSIFL
ncbi:MAG: AAA family ATPase [Candidatus Gracilibacteria bacterium]|nr:AAA family ATPase [Candidatus Gracilibacteria bacterium]